MKKFLTFLALACLTVTGAWAQWAPPFVAADSYENITHWYALNAHSNQTHYLYTNGGVITQQQNANYETTDNYAWGFVGNATDGYTIYNKATGSSVALDSNDPCTLSVAGVTTKWTVEASDETTEKGRAGFCIKVSGQDYVNFQSTSNPTGNLKRWSSKDAGSTFTPYELDFSSKTYTVHITGAPEGTQVTYNEVQYGNGETITATGLSANDIDPDEVDGFYANVFIDDTTIYVSYVEKIKSNQLYGLSTKNRGAWVVVDGVMKSTSHPSVNKSINSTDPFQQFAIYEYGGNKYLWNEGAQHFLNNAGQVVPIQQASPVEWSEEADGTYFFHFTDAAEKFININGSKVVEICYWNYADEGNMMYIDPAEGFNATTVANVIASDLSEKSFTVTITGAPAESNPQVTYNDQTVGNQGTIKAASVDANELKATEIAGYYPTITVSGTTITVTYTQLPFVQGQAYKMTLRGKNMYYDATSTQIKVKNDGIAEGDLTGCFKIEGTYAEGFIFYNIGAGKYFKVDDTSADNAKAKATADATSATRYDLVTPSNNGVGFTFKIHGTNNNYINERDNTFSTWNAGAGLNDGGGAMTFTAVEVAEIYDITFNFTGAATGTTVIKVESGVTPTLPAIPDYVEYTVTPALVAATANITYTINSSYKENVPFTVGQNKYYTIKQNRNPNLNVYVDGSEIKTVASSATPDSYYAWEFGGDWLNGFTLKNKAAAKYVSFGTDNPGDKTKATLVDATGDGAFFDFAINGDYSFLKVHGSANAYISNNGGTGTTYLTNWNTGNPFSDGGSQLIISEIEFGEMVTYTYTVTDANGATYTGSFTTDSPNPVPSFTGVEGYTLTNVTVNGTEITADITFPFPVNTPTAISGYKGNTGGNDQFWWRAAGTDIVVKKGDAPIGNDYAWTIIPAFAEGAFTFTFKSVATEKYVKVNATGSNHNQGAVTLDETANATSFTYTSNSFQVVGQTLYLSVNSSNPDTEQYVGVHNAIHNGSKMHFGDIASAGLDITIGATGYATFYDEVNRAIPEGVKAYYCELNDETGNLDAKLISSNAELTETPTVDYIPATYGVILEGTPGTTYTFEEVPNRDEEDYEALYPIQYGDVLIGSTTNTTVAEAKQASMEMLWWNETPADVIYVFSKVDGNFGFYKADESLVLGAHKAFYPVWMETGAEEIQGFTLDFGGQTVGVNSVISATNLKAGYDIQGRRINKTVRGINILNGKKIIK